MIFYNWLMTTIGPAILKILSIVLAVLAVILGARQWGKNAERLDNARSTIRAVEIRRKNEATDFSNRSDDKWLRAAP